MKPHTFAGVDGVKIVKTKKGKYAVMSIWLEKAPLRSGNWRVVAEYDTLDEAIEEAPYLCEF